MKKAFEKVNNIVADIALGDVKGFAGVFHALGISMDEIDGKDTSEAFEVIRNALEKVEDESLRAALANHLFGDKIGSDLLPMLSQEETAIYHNDKISNVHTFTSSLASKILGFNTKYLIKPEILSGIYHAIDQSTELENDLYKLNKDIGTNLQFLIKEILRDERFTNDNN